MLRTMSITRTAYPVSLLIAMLSAGTIAAQESDDTARYVILFSNRHAGFYKEWWSNGELHSVYQYNDRGRGPHLETILHAGPANLLTALSIVGHGYLKDT